MPYFIKKIKVIIVHQCKPLREYCGTIIRFSSKYDTDNAIECYVMHFTMIPIHSRLVRLDLQQNGLWDSRQL